MKPRWSNVVILLAAPAAPAALAPWIAHWHWTLDLLASFAAQSMLTLTIAAAALLIGRKWAAGAAYTVLAGIAVAATAPPWLRDDSFPQSPGNSPQLVVMTLNLLRNNEQGASMVLKTIQTERPDVIWCAEYTTAWQRALRRGLPDFPHRCELADDGHFGAAVFSRHPLLLAEMVPLGPEGTPACRAVLQTASGPIGFLGVHPPPPGLGHRRVELRDRGLLAVPLLLENLPERRIVCGDLNATPWQPAFAELRGRAELSAGSSATWLPSWPAGLPLPLRIPIDHVLTAGPLAITSARLGDAFGSDHLPLIATVRVLDAGG